MTRPSTPSQDRPDTPYVPPGHPVRRFVLATVGVGAAALALWWSALLAPRLESASVSGQTNLATHVGVVRVELVNRAPTPLEIRSGHVDAPAFTGHLLAIDGRSLRGGVRLGGGAHAIATVAYRYESCRAMQAARRSTLEIDVRTPSGLRRTRSLDLTGGLPLDVSCTD